MNIDSLPFVALSTILMFVVYWCYREFAIYRREIIEVKKHIIKLKNVIELELHGDFSEEESEESEEEEESDGESSEEESKIPSELKILSNPNVKHNAINKDEEEEEEESENEENLNKN